MFHPPLSRLTTKLFAAAIIAAVVAIQPGQAATTTWTGGSLPSDNWSAGTNWDNGAPSSTIDAIFYGTGAGRLTTNTIQSGGQAVLSLTYNSSSTTSVLTSGTGTLSIGNGGLTVQAGAAAHSISAPITFSGTSALVTIDNSAGYTASGTFDVGSNTRSFTKAGSGTLTLSGTAIDLRGGVSVTGGTVLLTGGASNGYFKPTSNNSNVSISSGAKIDVQGADGEINGTLTGSGEFTNGGAITRTLTLSRATAFTLDTILSGNLAINKTGNANITLTGANTYTGGTTISAGTFTLAGAGTLGSTSGSLTVNGGTIDLNGTNQGVGNFAGSGGTVLNNSTGTNVTLTIGNGNTGGGNYQGVIDDHSTGNGTVALTKTGTGTIALSGNNTYTGATTINSGTLSVGNIVGSGSNIGSGSSPVVLGGATTPGTLSYTGAAATYTRGFTVNAGGGGLTNAGTGLLQLSTGGTTVASGGTLTFATNANGIQQNVSSVISGAGGITLNSAGAGTLALLGQNTYQGGTTLQQGTMTIGSFSTITTGTLASGPVGTGTFHIGSGTNSATVNTTAATTRTLNNNISLDGDATFATTAASGTFIFDTVGTLTTPNSIALTRTNQVTINSTVALTLGGLISGSGFGITKLGAGTLNLGNGTGDTTNNIYSGLTTVTAGTLNLNKAANTNAFGGDITVNGGSLAYGTSNNEQIADSAKLTISSGTYAVGGRTETIGQAATAASGLALSGTGAITIGSGTLNVVNGAMTGGAVTLTAASGSLQTNNDFNFSGGTIDFTSTSGTSTTALNLRGGTGTGITYSASGTSAAQITNSGAGSAKVSLNTAGTTVFNIADAPSVAIEMSIAPSITGNTALQKTGAGVLSLSGASTYSGATTINAGTLNIDNNNTTSARLANTSGITVNSGGTLLFSQSGVTASTDRIKDTASITIYGDGTFKTGGLSEGIRPTSSVMNDGITGMGALSLQNTSVASRATIDFLTGANGSSLVFSSLSGGAGAFLDIKNWTGTLFTDNGATGNDRLLFGTDPGLSATQLANVRFFDDNGAFIGPGGIIPYGNMFELTCIPEPGTWLAGGLAFGVLVFSQRRRLQRAILRR